MTSHIGKVRSYSLVKMCVENSMDPPIFPFHQILVHMQSLLLDGTMNLTGKMKLHIQKWNELFRWAVYKLLSLHVTTNSLKKNLKIARHKSWINIYWWDKWRNKYMRVFSQTSFTWWYKTVQLRLSWSEKQIISFQFSIALLAVLNYK